MKKHQSLYYLAAFVINLVLISLIFLNAGLVPFGDNNFLSSDLGTQYIAFLTELRRQLVSGNIHLYLFSQSLGDNFFPIISYYLLSPFNLLLVLFKSSTVPVAADIIIMLKISTMGVTMLYFLTSYFKRVSYSNYIFTIAYSFCGFVASYFYDLMWLDALIMLPLVAVGLLKLIDKNKLLIYYFALFLTIVFNYYLGYMLCIFSVCFFIFLAMEKHLMQQKNRWYVIKNFVITSFLAGASAAVVLVPTFAGMLKTAKSSFNVLNYFPTPSFGFEALTQLGIGGNTFIQRLHHGPSVFMTTTVLVLLLSYFFSKRVAQEDKNHAMFLIGILLVSMLVTTFNTIWHMFQNPAGFPFRNSFIFSFVCIFIAHKAYSAGTFKETLALVKSTCTAGILICIGYSTEWLLPRMINELGFGTPDNKYNGIYFWLSIICIIISGILLYLFNYSRKFGGFILLLVAFEAFANFNSVIDTANFGSQKVYQHEYELEAGVLEKIKDKTKIGHRVIVYKSGLNKAFPEQYNNYNDPMLFNINGITLYSSTLNQNTLSMLQDLGYFSLNVRRISYIGGTELTNTLFGFNYEVGQWGNKYDIYKNYDSPSLGFMVSKNIYDYQLMPYHALDNQNELWQAINGTDIQYFKNPNLKNVSQETLGKKTKYEYDLTPTATGEMYFYVAPINYDHSNVYVNGQRIKLGTDVTSATVLDLGYFKKGESVNVNIVTRKELGINPGYFKTLDQSEFDKSKVQVQRNSLKVSSNLNNDTVKGTINVKEDNPMLLTIPYDDGWKAFDNGKKISTHKVVGNLTAIDLKKGHHDIVMKYEVPGLKAGWIITVIAIILFGLYYIYRKFIGVIDDYD